MDFLLYLLYLSIISDQEVTVMISSVYSYYMATYGAKPGNRHNAHKKSELRDVYNNIVKLNRSSPFYKIDVSEESQRRAIDLKESASGLSDITDDLTDAVSGDMTFQSIAESDNEDVVQAEYIGENKSAGSSRKFTIAVKQLATPQVNTGNYLNPKARNLFTGTYSFDVNISSVTYELQYSVKDGENNGDVQKKPARLINKSNIGLKADIVENQTGLTALRLTSNMTGIGDKPVIFTVTDENSSALPGTVSTLGLDKTTSYPSNAVFELNGDTKISSSNNFTVDREFDITLKSVSSDGEKVTIGLKQNMDSLVDSINKLADKFNRLASLAGNSSQFESHKLHDALSGIVSEYKNVLEANGLEAGDDGLLSVNEEKLKSSAKNGSLLGTLSQLGKFKDAVQQKAHDVMINPMEYINKVVVSYKNPKRPSADPYTTSIYSGMMYNSYC